jgi:aryl-alcohol dehydrogenase-like predicted oxidoreductase
MHYRRLGRSGLKLSEIAMEAWVTYTNYYFPSTNIAVIHACS